MKFRHKQHDITPAQLQEVYSELEEIFGEGNVVIIGGRAVNLYCAKDKRDTDDLDIVVRVDGGIDNEKLNTYFIQEDTYFIQKKSEKRWKLESRSYYIKIDVYLLYPGEERDERPVSGIPKEDILDHAIELQLPSGKSVRVADPVRLVLMKYNAHRDKDYEDISNIISHLYGNFENFLNGKDKLPGAKDIIRDYVAESGRSGEELESNMKYIIGHLKVIYKTYLDESIAAIKEARRNGLRK